MPAGTPNEPVGTSVSWGRFLPEHTTAVSLLDRLLHHANVVVTAGDSYRMRQARARGGNTLTKK
jgi:DNA replication protein DnaC